MVKASKRSIYIVIALFCLYVVAVLLRTEFWADLTAPVCDLLAAGLIFHAVFTSPNKQFRVNYILAGSAVLSWGIADTLWFLYAHVLMINPETSDLIAAFYFFTNVFLVVAMILYAYYRLRKRDTVQLILNGVIFSMAILWLLWVLMYNRETAQLGLLMKNSVMNSIAISLDAFLLIVIGIWYMSIRKGALPLFLQILVGSVAFFALTDLIYFHLYIRILYIPDSLIDVCYLAALIALAVSIKLYYLKYPAAYTNENPNTKIGNMHKGLILLACPILIVIFNQIAVIDIILYAALIVVHEFASSFIQNSIRNKERLNREIDTNKELEQLVSEKTNDLKSANDELRRRNEDLNYIIQHDPLTGLHNRAYFLERLDELIDTANETERVALILWNVDDLKGINDTYGHLTGDKILIQHAERVKKLFAGTGSLARLGGDEFAFAFRGMFADGEPLRLAKLVVQTCSEPLQVGEYSFLISVAVGISLIPVCASDRSTLLKNADIAMHFAKETRPDSHIAKYLDIDRAMERKYRIGNSLRNADYSRDLRQHFQPQFRIADKQLIGMEALLRWDCPGIGPVSPAEFIPIAEEENLIIPIGNWVIDNAVRQIAEWNHAHHTNLRMGINISPKQFDQMTTLKVLDEAIRRHQAAFDWIDIEITEGVALDNEDSAGNIKKYFKNKGITVSIDDFGTGYSSLGYLTILSFNRLKIAKPLVDKITRDESSRKIVTSIILLAKSLDLQTIAEGVETKAQFDLLKKLGCDQIQGYYLGMPVPAGEFEAQFLQPLHAAETDKQAL